MSDPRCPFSSIFFPPFAADLQSSSPSSPECPPREFTVRISSNFHSPLLTAAAAPGGGPRSVDRNPAVLHKPLLRSSDRVDQHVGPELTHPLLATQLSLQDVSTVGSYWLSALASLGLLAHCPRERRRPNNSRCDWYHGSRSRFCRNNSCPRSPKRCPGWNPTHSLILDRNCRVVLCSCILRVRAPFLAPSHPLRH